jgi:6,7-dimethyl-8-ribityllumazine synthase
VPRLLDPPPLIPDARFAIVVSRFHKDITARLLEGAVATLTRHGVQDQLIHVAWVPGAWEIPLVAQELASHGTYEAILCLGAVIQGETTHDRQINRQVSASLGQLAREMKIPVLFGVLTCPTWEHAIERAGSGDKGNKGSECAEAALQMVALMRHLRELNAR